MERETLEMDVVFVGAGPANLSGALHLARLIKTHNEAVGNGERQGEALGEIEIGVIEKGASVGAHILSGAVMDPRALRELMPDFVEQGAPLESPVNEDYFLYLTKNRAIRVGKIHNELALQIDSFTDDSAISNILQIVGANEPAQGHLAGRESFPCAAASRGGERVA